MLNSDRPVWFNGNIINASDAKISVFSPAAQFGLNVFEGVRCYTNAETGELFAFRLDDHLKRLWESCKIIGIEPSHSQTVIVNAIKKLVSTGFYSGDVSLRITFFVYDEGSWQNSGPVGLFIAPISKKRNSIPSSNPKTAGISSWQRISDLSLPPRVKAGANYINGRYAQLEANRKGFDLPVFLDSKGIVSEGAGACIMIVKDNKLITPSLTSSILASITRDTLLIIADYLSIKVEIRDINRTELYVADEVFLCGSAAELTSISQVDGYELPVCKEVTDKLSEFYFSCADGSLVLKDGWLHSLGVINVNN